MRVLFVFPDLSAGMTGYSGVLSYGLGSLSAALRGAGHDVSLYHITAPPDPDDFRARVRAARPDLVAFSSNSHYARRLATWTRWAREAAGAPVAIGGIHATIAPEQVAELPAVDYICIGEGEEALRELCAALQEGRDPTGIESFWVRRPSGFVRNRIRPVTHDLDAQPDPDFSIFDFDRLSPVREGTFTYLMSRGCAYGCTYCCMHKLRSVAPRRGPFWRFLSPRRAVEQLRSLLDRYMPDARMVTFVDAIFCPDREWLAEFVPLYKERIGVPASCNMRADRVDGETATLLQELGVRIVRMGVESGDPRITSEVLHRSLDLEDIRRAFSLLRQRGVARWSYNMIGLPSETLSEALRTVRLNAELAPEQMLAFLFYPYPGTELHRVCRELGYLTESEFDTYREHVAIRMPQFPRRDILFVHRFFHLLTRLYRFGERLPPVGGTRWTGALNAALTSPLFPRGLMVRLHEAYHRVRHGAGVFLLPRAPRLYRLLGGRAPVWRPDADVQGTAG
jgi:radical SAM superfamily enzyme YgiQ (UPF0313 family)